MPDQAEIDAHRQFAICFGRNLVRARKAAGVSQEAVAIEAALHRTEIGMLERGIRIPRIDTALKLACALDVSIDELVEGVKWRATVRTGGWLSSSPGDEASSAH